MKKILLLGTGGTIVSEKSQNGLKPSQNTDKIFSVVQNLHTDCILEYKNILNLDSSNIQMEEWQKIARHIYKSLGQYSGIIVTHGTDTMAYTASVLTFMLQNVSKPVILTGSQLPIGHPHSDAESNLSLAVEAVEQGIHGVNIAFHHKIIKGCRAVKVRTMSFDAFESVNYPYMAEYTSGGMGKSDGFSPNTQQPPERPIQLLPDLCGDVFLLKLVPGTNPKIFDALLNLHYRGVVIEAFGIGGIHFMRRDLADKIQQLILHGTAVVVRSQCLYEQSDFSVYEVGKKLLENGVIPGRNMTTEACITKLMWALGQSSELEDIRKIFETNYADEITLDESIDSNA